MTTDDDDELLDPPLSPVSHRRLELPGRPDVGIENTTLEFRGVQSYRRNNYKNPSITEGEETLNEPDNIALQSSMARHANRILRSAGHLDWPHLMDLVDQAKENKSIEPNLIDIMPDAWRRSIEKAHGHLSIEHKAATFLLAWDKMLEKFGGNFAVLKRVVDFCESSYWMQFELMDYHYLVIQGARATQGRAKSAPARKAQKAKRLEVVERAVANYIKEHPRFSNGYGVVQTVTHSIDREVNAELEAQGHEPYKDSTLLKVVGEILKNRKKAS